MAGMNIQPWQQKMLSQMASFSKDKSISTGVINLTASGRKTGKSIWAHLVKELTMPDIKILDSAEVDGKIWYTVQLSVPAREWLREQPLDDWREHIDQRYYINRSMFDVSERMYSALMIKWN